MHLKKLIIKTLIKYFKLNILQEHEVIKEVIYRENVCMRYRRRYGMVGILQVW